MPSAGWFRGKGSEVINTRSVFVRVNPTPLNLSERRAVLHALQRHAKVEVFKRLPAPSSFVCAFADRATAVGMVRKSPLTFKFVSEPLESIQFKSAPGAHPVGVAAPIDLHFVENESEIIRRGDTDPSTPDSDPIKAFTLWVQMSENRYSHHTNINRNPIHGPWPEATSSDRDFVYHALKEVVPDNIAQQALCDWVTGGQLSEDAKQARTDKTTSAEWQIRDRIERRRKREQLSAQDSELTSWTSIKAVCRPQGADDIIAKKPDPAFGPAPRSESIGDDFGSESVGDDSGSETVSEPFRVNGQQNSWLEKLLNPSKAEGAASDQADVSEAQRNSDGSRVGSASEKALQETLEIPISSNAAPVPDHGSESQRSEPGIESYEHQIPPGHSKGT